MSQGPDLGYCRVKLGLLFLRDCREQAVGMCSHCGRPVCAAHQVLEDEFVYCPECASDAGRGGRTPQVQSTLRRREYYQYYGYHPYYYGRHAYFSDHDFRTFDDSEIVHHEPAERDVEEGGTSGGDFDQAAES